MRIPLRTARRYPLATLAFAAATVATAAGGARAVDFDRDVRPILSDNCFPCHGPDAETRKARLRLDTRDGLFARRARRTIVAPGDPAASELIARIASRDDDERMPPLDSMRSLSRAEIETIETWVRDGARWERHWAFVAPERREPPEVLRRDWPRNAIDRFVLARLERDGLSPAAEAPRERLIRRVTLDLTGIPPRLDEVDAFLADDAPDAYERVVDRLLASPRYGERMAWEWLDAARYADSNGFQGDAERTMWPWRDWVVRALDANLPFDRFSIEQLAGDLLPEATLDQRIATGFHRNQMFNGEGGRIAEETRVENAFDRVETTATVWLGVTIGCARCHDHKFDPFSQRDYFGLFAYFDNTSEDGSPGRSPGAVPPVVRGLTPEQQVELAQLDLRIALAEQRAVAQGELDALRRDRDELESSAPLVMVLDERETRRTTRILARGAYDKPGEEVEARVPDAILPLAGSAPPNRLTLARWLFDASNPLTARVAVNGYWRVFFGTGIVRTVEDLGTQGEKPSHPELLDWLACEFVRSGWDVKAMHRLIVTSATYRQSEALSARARELDPENRLLARGPRGRLPSWMIRDQALAISGLLVERRGGPSVFPYQPDGIWAEATFGTKRYPRGKGDDLWRRSLYTFWRRIVGPTVFFDVSKRQTCAVRTPVTNTPLHALVTLNDVTFVEAARVLAERVLSGDATSDEARMEIAWRLATSRRPNREERELLIERLAILRGQYAADRDAALALVAVGEAPRDERLDPIEHAAYTALALLVLNLDETLTK